MTDKPAKLVQIRMLWHEGYVTEAPYGGYSGKTYTNLHAYQSDLVKIDQANDDRPPGAYTKTKARFTYDDESSVERRVDLGDNDYQPREEFVGDYLERTDPERWDKKHKELNPGRRDPQYEDSGYMASPAASRRSSNGPAWLAR